LDVSDPKSNDFIFNSEELEKKGAWGLFHELGHNMQQGWWSKYSIFFPNKIRKYHFFLSV
jgi:hypothetical protein